MDHSTFRTYRTVTARLLATALLFMGLIMTPLTSAWAEDLTEARVGQFIQSLNQIGSIADEHEGALGAMGDLGSLSRDPSRITSPFTSGLESMQAHAAFGQIAQVIRDHGFVDAAAWAQTGDQVFRAFGALQMRNTSTDLSAEMQKAMEELERSGLPEAQKRQMMEMMQISSQSLQAFSDVSEADQAAVAPFSQALKNLR